MALIYCNWMPVHIKDPPDQEKVRGIFYAHADAKERCH